MLIIILFCGVRQLIPGSTPSVSLIIPVARMAGKLSNLEKLISSVGNENVQLIVVHDVSDENTGLELKQILDREKNPRVTLLEGKFGSPGLARNEGLSKAKGNWIWFCDSDDEPDIATVINELSSIRDSADVVVFNFSRVNEISGEEIKGDGLPDLISIALNPGVWRILFKKEILKGVLFSNYMLGEDQLFLVESGILQREIHFSERNAYKYYFGGLNHLVDRRDRVGDLVEVFKRTAQIAPNLEGSESETVKLIALRQFFTLMKIGTILERLNSIEIACKFIKQDQKFVKSWFRTLKIFLGRNMTS